MVPGGALGAAMDGFEIAEGSVRAGGGSAAGKLAVGAAALRRIGGDFFLMVSLGPVRWQLHGSRDVGNGQRLQGCKFN